MTDFTMQAGDKGFTMLSEIIDAESSYQFPIVTTDENPLADDTWLNFKFKKDEFTLTPLSFFQRQQVANQLVKWAFFDLVVSSANESVVNIIFKCPGYHEETHSLEPTDFIGIIPSEISTLVFNPTTLDYEATVVVGGTHVPINIPRELMDSAYHKFDAEVVDNADAEE